MIKRSNSIMHWCGLLALSSFISACSDNVEPLEKEVIRPVKLFTVQNPTAHLVRHFPGIVVPSKSAELSFRISGTLTTLTNLAGTLVSKGQVLASLESRDAKNDYESREAAFDLAKAEQDRNQKLLDKGLISKSIFDQAKAELRSATAALAAAKDNMSYTRLTAPFDGIITTVNVENFQDVMAQDPIMLIENKDFVDISIEVPERFVINLADDPNPNGYQSDVSFPSFPGKTFKVSFKEASLAPTAGSQTYTMVATMPRPKNMRLQQGMTAKLTVDFSKLVTINPQKVFVRVPTTSVAYPDDKILNDKTYNGAVVWRFNPENNQLSKVKVTLGEISADGIEITQGIKPGDIIVSAGVRRLKQGQTVKAWQRERGL